MIDAPGIYITRSGVRVKIDEVGVSPEGCWAAKCKGYAERMFRGKLRWNGRRIWHESGSYIAVGEHPMDIIKKESEC